MRKFLSFIFYILWGLPIMLGTLGLFGTLPWIVDRSYYRSIVEDERLYNILKAEEIAETIAPEIQIEGIILHGPSMVKAVQRNFPEEELHTLGIQAIERGMDYVEGISSNPVELDLGPLKNALEERKNELGATYLLLAPEKYLLSNESSAMPSLVEAAIDTIPNKAILEREAFPDQIFLKPPLTQGQINIRAISLGILAAASLVALSFLGGGGSTVMLARAGAMLGFPSVLVLLLGLVLALPGASFMIQLLPLEIRAVAQSPLRDMIRPFMAMILSPIAKGFFLSGLVGTSLSGLLKALGRYLPRKED